MFNHPQIPFGSLISGEALKAFAERGDFEIMSFCISGRNTDIPSIANILDDSIWVTCLDAFGKDEIAIFRCLCDEPGVMATQRQEIAAYTSKPTDAD